MASPSRNFTWFPPWPWQGHRPTGLCMSSGLHAESMHACRWKPAICEQRKQLLSKWKGALPDFHPACGKGIVPRACSSRSYGLPNLDTSCCRSPNCVSTDRYIPVKAIIMQNWHNKRWMLENGSRDEGHRVGTGMFEIFTTKCNLLLF